MNIAIYTECPTEFYFRNLRELEKSKLIKIKIYDSRIARTAYHNPFRAIKHLFNPIRLLFHKKIIINFAPYSWAVFYFLILKLLKKDLIFFTSWPYWEENVKVPRVRFPFDRKLWKIFLKNIKIVVLNNETKLALEKFEDNKNIFIIPHGVDTQLFKPIKKSKSKKVRILFVGRLIKEKGINLVLELSEYFKEKAEFVIIGDGPEKEKVKNNKFIKYLGSINNESKLAFQNGISDISINTSYKIDKWEEWFGLTVIEAMSSGLPVISSNCIGPRQIISDNKDGFIVEQKNLNEFKSKLSKLIDNPNLRKSFSLAARKKALNYDISKLSKEWLKVLKSI